MLTTTMTSRPAATSSFINAHNYEDVTPGRHEPLHMNAHSYGESVTSHPVAVSNFISPHKSSYDDVKLNFDLIRTLKCSTIANYQKKLKHS